KKPPSTATIKHLEEPKVPAMVKPAVSPARATSKAASILVMPVPGVKLKKEPIAAENHPAAKVQTRAPQTMIPQKQGVVRPPVSENYVPGLWDDLFPTGSANINGTSKKLGTV